MIKNIGFNITAPSQPDFTPIEIWDIAGNVIIEFKNLPKFVLPVLMKLSDDGSKELMNGIWHDEKPQLFVGNMPSRIILIRGQESVVIERV